MTYIKIALVVIVLVVVLLVILSMVLKDIPIPAPTGTYRVGTRTLEAVDAERRCPFSGEKRKLFARVFYPAEQGGSTMEPYMEKALSEAYAKQLGIPAVAFGKEVASFASLDVPVSTAEKRYPVLLFNHGYGAFMKSNMALFQELCSYGYIILSIGHAYESAYVPFESGAITMDPAILTRMKELNRNPKALGEGLYHSLKRVKTAKDFVQYTQEMQRLSTENEPYFILKESVTLWKEDSKAILREIKKRQECEGAESFWDSFDLTRVGVLGHSFGGIIAGELCMDSVEGVRCGLNFDAPPLLFEEEYNPLQVPFGFCSSEKQKVSTWEFEMAGVFDPLLERSAYPGFSCSFQKSAHYDFCDMTFATAMKKFTPMLGSIDPLVMNESLNKTTRLFFDAYLKDGSIDSLEQYHQSLPYTHFKSFKKGE